jgi:putative FmdB family regulatory protein
MPTYDYRCKGCGHEMELFQSMTEAPKRKCPACAKNTLERLIGTGAALIFKGSGFYQTDYRSESYKKAAEADSKPSNGDAKTETKASEGKSAETKSDSKSESKPAAEPKKTTAKPKAKSKSR